MTGGVRHLPCGQAMNSNLFCHKSCRYTVLRRGLLRTPLHLLRFGNYLLIMLTTVS